MHYMTCRCHEGGQLGAGKLILVGRGGGGGASSQHAAAVGTQMHPDCTQIQGKLPDCASMGGGLLTSQECFASQFRQPGVMRAASPVRGCWGRAFHNVPPTGGRQGWGGCLGRPAGSQGTSRRVMAMRASWAVQRHGLCILIPPSSVACQQPRTAAATSA